MISREFRQALVEDALTDEHKRRVGQCAWCGWHWNPQPGIDVGRAVVLGLAVRVSFGAAVAEELGWVLPWRLRFQSRQILLDEQLRAVADVVIDGGHYELSFKATADSPELERCGKGLAVDLLRKNPPSSVNQAYALRVFAKKLDERWPLADFHTCGKSLTRAVRRVVMEFDKP